jgi:hypothetical protein
MKKNVKSVLCEGLPLCSLSFYPFTSLPGYVVVDDVKVHCRTSKVKSGFKPFYYGKG